MFSLATLCVLASPALADTQPWMAELPALGAVRAAIKGRDAADTTAQVDAALQVLLDYADIRIGISEYLYVQNKPTSRPAEVQPILAEYWRARTKLPAENNRPNFIFWSMTPAARRYLVDETFRLRILSRFLSPASLQAYRASEGFANMGGAYTNLKQTEALQRRLDEQQARADAQVATTKRAASGDTAAAARDKVDLGVFDLRMGAELKLPPCPGSSAGGITQTDDGDLAIGSPEPSGTRTCEPQGTFAEARLAQARSSASDLHGGTLLLAQLPKSRCPDWVRAGARRCALQVVVKDGVLVAVGFFAGGERWQKTIESNLVAKYGARKLDKTQIVQCKRRSLGLVTQEMPVRDWALSGLHVRYNPLATCAEDDDSGSGWVQVELDSYRQRAQVEDGEKRAAEPKM